MNELLDLDQVMKQLNELIRQSIVKPLREQGGEEMVLQDDLEKLFAKLEQEVPDFQKWKYGLSDMAPYRKDIDAITDRWLQQYIQRIGVRFRKLGTHWKSNRSAHMEKMHEGKPIE